MKPLRPYQREGIQQIFDTWRQGRRSVLFQMPTGTGKTVLFSHIVKRGYDHGRKMLIVVHRRELIDQALSHLRGHGIDAGIILAGYPSDYEKIVQVASIQTLSRRQHPDANLVIIDECHHAKAKTYRRLWALYPDAKFLGVTATPIRLDGKGFADMFDVLIPSMQIQEFIKQGYLAEVKYFVGAVPDLKGVKTRHGDYVNESLSRILLHQEYLVNVVQSYQRHAPGKSMIVFAVNVAHSQAIVDRYRDAGIRAAHLDGNTPKAERERLLAHFTANEIQVLSNCEIITEGFDFPACEVVQLTRPTKSLTLYLQSVGRVMRPAAGKSSGMILDNAGCWLEHGFATMDREWTLEGVEKQHTQLVGRDPEGTVHDVQRTPPDELQGLELLEATEELQRLLVFETFLHEAQRWNHKVISAYFRYLEYLDATGDVLSTQEFEYLKRRLNRVNSSVDAAKRFNPRFWVVQEKRYQRTNYARQVLSYGQTRPTVEVEVQWA